MSLLKTLLEEKKIDNSFDSNDVISKMKNAKKTNDLNNTTVAFGLKDENNNVVVVYVDAEQADDFENDLSAKLDELQGKEEIAKILWDMREKFDIVNVDWPAIPEDEEEQTVVDTEGGEAAGGVEPPGDETDLEGDAVSDEDLEGDVEPVDKTEDDAKSALQAVIAMMKADADAKRAEAEARKAEANAEEAKYAAHAAEFKIKSQEEILDMEAYEKEKGEKDKEAKQLAKLAKFRHDKAQDAENALTGATTNSVPQSEPVQSEPVSAAPEEEEDVDVDGDGLANDEEYLKFVQKYLINRRSDR